MTPIFERRSSSHREDSSGADEKLQRILRVIAEDFDGDTVAYYETIRRKRADERDGCEDGKSETSVLHADACR